MKFKSKKALKEFLDAQVELFEKPEFFESDPLGIPHRFSKKEDIEIIGFLAATIAWGNRKSIINSANRMCALMDNAPHDFILNHTEQDYRKLDGFVHRTFNSVDLQYFFYSLKRLYKEQKGLEGIFTDGFSSEGNAAGAISNFKKEFFQFEHLKRSEKHVSDPMKGSSAKRLNMYLRWMVRSADKGVDFGLWKDIPSSKLIIPLDVHTGNIGRKLGLLKRTQNDWRAVEELMAGLRKFDSVDPAKYDFALFGLGVSGF
ncbi:MAG: TIGR02757 family protein [Flavobacteriales bacterium]